MRKRTKNKKEYQLLTILRAIAFFAIALFHSYSHFLPGGYLAVIIFLLLSGFLSQKGSYRKKYDLKSFLNKLINLMAPVYFVMAISMIFALFFAREIFDDSVKSLIPVALNFENISRILQGDDYFSQLGNFNIFLHLWYISLYMQFIAIFYLLEGFFKKIKNENFKGIFYLLLALISFYLILHFGKTSKDITRIYYGIDTRFSAFALGVSFFILGKKIRLKVLKSKLQYQVCLIILALLTIIPFFVIDGKNISSYKIFFIGYSLIIALLVLCLYNYEDLYLQNKNSTNFVEKVLIYLGDRSYYFYLWQYVVQIFFTYFQVKVLSIVFLNMLIQLVIIILLGEFTYQLFKNKNLKLNLLLLSIISLIAINVVSLAIGNAKKEEIANLKKEMEANQDIIEQKNKEIIEKNKKKELDKKKQEEKENKEDSSEIIANNQNDLENEIDEIPETKRLEDNFKPKDYNDFEFTENELNYLKELNISAIGDSVIINADSYIRKFTPNFYLDGEVGRDMVSAAEVLRSVKANAGLGDLVVVALGSNGSANENDLKNVMEVADGRDVYFVNTSHTQSYMDYVNKSLKEFTDKNQKAHLVDWREYVKDRPDLLAPDRTHPNVPGSDGYAKLILRKILNVNKVSP